MKKKKQTKIEQGAHQDGGKMLNKMLTKILTNILTKMLFKMLPNMLTNMLIKKLLMMLTNDAYLCNLLHKFVNFINDAKISEKFSISQRYSGKKCVSIWH